MKHEDIEYIRKTIENIYKSISEIDEHTNNEHLFYIIGSWHGQIMEYLRQKHNQLEKMESKSSCK